MDASTDKCDFMPVERRIDADSGGLRVDKYIRENFAGVPQSLIEKLVRKRLITVDGERAASNKRLVCGQTLVIRHPLKGSIAAERPQTSPPQRLIDSVLDSVVFEDEEIMVLNKPANLSTQGGSCVAHSVDSILRHVGQQRGIEYRLTHRIDRETTGILVIAKTRQVAAEITQAFRERKVQKEYVALTWGMPSQMHVEAMVSDAGAIAETECELMLHSGLFSVLRLHPHTGHKHQLRIHMAGVGSPILGDSKYGNRTADRQYAIRHLYLHARSISLPRFDKISASMPRHFADLLGRYNMAGILESQLARV